MRERVGEALRKLRGAAGTAVTWGFAWAILSLVPSLVLIAVFPQVRQNALDLVGDLMLIFGTAGVVSGGLFSLLLGTVYRRRRLGDLRPRRVGLWGAAAAAALAFVGLRTIASGGADLEPPVGLAILFTSGAFGWGTAALTVKLAQAGDGELEKPGDRPRLR